MPFILSQHNGSDYMTEEILGINTPYIYHGFKSFFFALHTEDYDLCSISYLHRGAPKYFFFGMYSTLHFRIWSAFKREDQQKIKEFCKNRFETNFFNCDNFIRHKTILLDPCVLQRYISDLKKEKNGI